MKYLYLLLLFVSLNSFAEELVKINVLDGKISILAPASFSRMSKERLEIKYPNSTRPKEVLSDKSGGVTLAFNHTNDALKPSQIREAHEILSKSFHNLYPSAKWIRDEEIQQNGKNYIVMELITPAIDTQIHNIMYFTSLEGRLLLASFNTTVQNSDEWLPVGKQIMSSLVLNN